MVARHLSLMYVSCGFVELARALARPIMNVRYGYGRRESSCCPDFYLARVPPSLQIMYIAYADESGDSGYENTPSDAFVLSILLVHESDWLRLLDRLVAMRRYLRKTYGLSPRVELKANHLIQRQGIFRRLSLGPDERLDIDRLAMKFQRIEAAFTSFAVYIDKARVLKKERDPREFAWGMAGNAFDEGESNRRRSGWDQGFPA